jgi:hypothetical protein
MWVTASLELIRKAGKAYQREVYSLLTLKAKLWKLGASGSQCAH